MLAEACGTMRIDRLITRTTSAMNTTSRMVPTRGLMAASLPRPERGSGGLPGFRACLLRYRPRASSASGQQRRYHGGLPPWHPRLEPVRILRWGVADVTGYDVRGAGS